MIITRDPPLETARLLAPPKSCALNRSPVIAPIALIALAATLTLTLSACVSPPEKSGHSPAYNAFFSPFGTPTNSSCLEAAPPAAIFFLPRDDSKSLPAEATQSLRDVLDSLRGQKNILFTLETLPDTGGSLEVNLGVARRSLNQLRNKLVELGVRSYRIKTLIRGEPETGAACNSKAASSPEKQRVELFLSSMNR